MICLLLTAVCLSVLRPTAYRFDLIDEPCIRKRHVKATPLLGGVSIFLGFFFAVLVGVDAGPMLRSFLLAAGLMVALGVIDDKYDINAVVRLIGQTAIASVLIFAGGIRFHTLGDLFSHGEVELGWFAVPFTYLAILAAINAFNMIDGIDGLLGGIALTTFSSLSLLAALHGSATLAYFSLVIAVALIPFLIANLGLRGQRCKVFMGDSGSIFIGLAAVWLLVIATQHGHATDSLKPITAVWLVAIPIMDIVTVMCRRIVAGRSPLQAGRDHIHHKYMSAGFTVRQTLAVLLAYSVIFQVIGGLCDLLNVPDHLMLLGFVAAYLAYLLHLPWLKKRANRIVLNQVTR